MTETNSELRVTALRWEADDIISVELQALDQRPLPRFSPGAHLDLQLGPHLIRQYSICNDPSETHRYVVAVSLDPASRGGSRYIHEQLRVGHWLRTRGPHNHFPLASTALEHVLIAGGIGITPLLAMYRQLQREQQACTLYYAVRHPSRAAFIDDIKRLDGHFNLHIDELAKQPLAIKPIVERHPQADFYCCGPAGMLQAFEAATHALPAERVHVEYFAPKASNPAAVAANSFIVECRQSAKTVEVGADQSILDALAAIDIQIPCSCQEGICGTCETRVLEGEPLHLDSVLSQSERASNRSMMPCVSRCKGTRLVLDL